MAIGKRLRFEILRRDAFTCQYCGRKAPEVTLDVDHMVPTALGGTDDPTNLVTACSECNSGKASIHPDSAQVEDLREVADQWNDAMRRAAAFQTAQIESESEVVDAFSMAWGSQNYLPDGWQSSLRAMARGGLSPTEAGYFAVYAQSASRHNYFRYFCGCVWNHLGNRQNLAAQIIHGEDIESLPQLLDDVGSLLRTLWERFNEARGLSIALDDDLWEVEYIAEEAPRGGITESQLTSAVFVAFEDDAGTQTYDRLCDNLRTLWSSDRKASEVQQAWFQYFGANMVALNGADPLPELLEMLDSGLEIGDLLPIFPDLPRTTEDLPNGWLVSLEDTRWDVFSTWASRIRHWNNATDT